MTNAAELKVTVDALLKKVIAAAASGDGAISELAEAYAAANRQLSDARRSENSTAIDTAKDALNVAVRAIIESSGLETLMDKPITGLTYTVNPASGENGATYSTVISTRVRTPKENTGVVDGTKIVGRTMVERLGTDGKPETLKASEVVDKYANQDIRAGKSFRNRNYTYLFPRVNQTLVPMFVSVAAEAATAS